MRLPVETFSVIGTGVMGSGIAQVAAAAGCPVTVSDLSPEALERGRAGVDASLGALVRRGRLAEAEAREMAGRIRWTTNLEDHAGAELVLEAIGEDLEIKRGLFARLETVAPDAVLASNTSSLSITELAAGLARPERLVGMHFFNPAPAMRLVEVVAGALTGAEAEARVFEAAKAWGKTPVRVQDVPGFIVNRVARPFYSEGLRAWSEGAGSAEDIDAAFRELAGFRMGPLELADLIGHDVNWAAAQSVYAAYFGRTRFTPQLAQGRLVAAGRLGRKTGRGVYVYPAPPADAGAPGESVQPIEWASPFEAEGVAFRPADGRSAALHAAERGGPVVLVDWARPGARCVGFVASDAAARGLAQRLAGEAGVKAIAMRDRPGGVVLRTLAQLANSAADAVRDRVADAPSIDQALVLGANYPQGPLAWADEAGAAHVVRVLDNIAAETGEEMYRPSEVLRRAAATGRKLTSPDAKEF